MTATTPTVVHQLSQLLLHSLGKSAPEAAWQRTLQPLGKLHHSRTTDKSSLQGEGLRLCMVELEGEPPDSTVEGAAPLQGLHSISLQARRDADGNAAWPHEWPLGLQAADLGKAKVLQALGPALVNTKTLSLWECKAGDAQNAESIGVQCDWGQQQQLVCMTLLRLNPFEPLPPVEFVKPLPPPPPAPAAPAPKRPAPTCLSGAPTPETGLYKGLLSAWHVDAKYYNAPPGCFCFKKKGEPMLRMGVVPREDEALVVWTWIKER